ncbi:unnamed protein product [Sphagnum tenellum]
MGVGLNSNGGISYSGYTPPMSYEEQLFYYMNTEFMRNRPKDRKVQDAVYPLDIDIDNAFMRFHLLVWRESGDERKTNFWSLIDISNHVSEIINGTGMNQPVAGNRLIFLSRKARREFISWWTTYTTRFFGGIAPVDIFLPKIRPGPVSGSFVEHQTPLDHLPYYNNNPTLVSDLIRGLNETLPSWAWISTNCRKPVYRIAGGWLFSSSAEAAKYVLFNPMIKTEI